MDEISYQKLLTTRVKDLKLNIEESMKPYFDVLKKELKAKKIDPWPDFYFGNEWGCVDKTISICIPFYFANEELKTLEGSTITQEELTKILRHETGHTINYAYKLWKRKDWKEIFGNFNKKYPKNYIQKVNPWSRDYVKYMHYVEDPHYAQRHPDEDWAETFAVWLDSKSRWQKRYDNWPIALQKLNYIDQLTKETAGTEPVNLRTKRDGEYTTIEDTVSEWWGLGEEEDDKIQEYMRDMNELFTKRKKNLEPAYHLIKRHAKQLSEQVSSWILGSNKHSVRKCLRQWENICKKEELGYASGEEEKKLIELSILLTHHTFDSTGKLKN